MSGDYPFGGTQASGDQVVALAEPVETLRDAGPWAPSPGPLGHTLPDVGEVTPPFRLSGSGGRPLQATKAIYADRSRLSAEIEKPKVIPPRRTAGGSIRCPKTSDVTIA